MGPAVFLWADLLVLRATMKSTVPPITTRRQPRDAGGRGKGSHDRPALLPGAVRDARRVQLGDVAVRHRTELAVGRGEVDLPHALRLELPKAGTSLAWQYIFPASRSCSAPATGRLVLHHLHGSAMQKAVLAASRRRVPPRSTSAPRATPCATASRPRSSSRAPTAEGGHRRRAGEQLRGIDVEQALVGARG
jgi:hypothetical protein